ncbi:MAG: chromate transporter [Synergistes jonesii]|uniref:chromate transporter n=1 Tax=Synergistes jonesii TaxID=2754 RepID=UPI002A75FB11|nr:chromate transporter [Synergistes jonesii]MDY2985194.1 chromate transporter [Synergistes jonesii]
MSLLELFLFFFKISSVTFGGGIVILGIVQLEQEKRRDIDGETFADMVSLATSVPGPIAVSIAWLMGRHYKGLAGSLAAVAGAVLPPFLIILILSPYIIKYSNAPAVRGFFAGVLAGTGAIISVVIFDNVKGALWGKWWNLVPYLSVVSMIGVFRLHPLLVMAAVIALQYFHGRICAE